MCMSCFAPYNKEIKVQREREEKVKITAHTCDRSKKDVQEQLGGKRKHYTILVVEETSFYLKHKLTRKSDIFT